MIFNPLPPIWKAYQTISNCLKMATEKPVQAAPLTNDTELVDELPADSYHAIQQSHAELNDLFVLALWATFERCIRDYLQVKGDKLKTVLPTTLANPLYEHFYDEVEYWKPYDMLDMLKATLSSTLLGHARQIVKYRDWVAHGRTPKKLPSAIIKPSEAYKTLNEIINTLPD
jgi:hypothetical protein